MSTLGRYEVEAEIGRGAMGTVYRAYDARVRRRVALKTFVIPEGLSPEENRERRKRFFREAQAAGSLSHPGIVTVFEVDEDPRHGIPFIAMEYVPGRSLREVLAAEGPLPVELVLSMAATLAGALQSAHDAGIVHRDVKPSNVLVREPDGAVKIADFGVARTPTSELTQSGTTVGSPAYMSPEQFRGEALDGRSDLFSLAAILYEALSGRRPFPGTDLPSIAYAIVHETPAPITEHAPHLPPELDRFFERALAKNPDDRYPDGATFGLALEEAVERARPASLAAAATGKPPAPPAPDPQRDDVATSRRGAPWVAPVALAIVGAVLAAALAWGLLRDPGPSPRRDGASSRPDEPVAASVAAAAPEPDASLRLSGRSSVRRGTLILLVDGAEVYSRPLSTEPGKVKRVFKRMAGRVREDFEVSIPVHPGTREIVARVRLESDGSEFEDRLTVDVEAGASVRIELVAGRVLGRPLILRAG